MKKIKDSIRNKELLALMITIVLFFLIRVVLLIVGTKFSETREDELLHMKMDTLMEIVSDGNAKRAAADATIYANQKANVNLMTNLLKEFATKDGYAGPRVFSDGFVAELQGERVILPREYRTFDTQITREMIEKSLASGKMMTGYAIVGNAATEEAAPEDMEKAEEAYVDELSKSCFLSFGKISENYVYVDLLSEIEYTEYLDLGSYNIYEALESADATFNGITVVIRDQDGELQLLRQFGAGKPFESLAGLGLTKELTRKVLNGGETTREEALELYDAPLDELTVAANEIRERFCKRDFDLCSIVNAKSGRCSEDCKFCAQSARYATKCDEHPILPVETLVAAAKRNICISYKCSRGSLLKSRLPRGRCCSAL